MSNVHMKMKKPPIKPILASGLVVNEHVKKLKVLACGDKIDEDGLKAFYASLHLSKEYPENLEEFKNSHCELEDRKEIYSYIYTYFIC